MFHDAINSIEISVDISSSVVAKGILSVCKGALDLLDIELNFLLQGHDTKTLPERLIGGVRVTQVDLAACVDTALSRAAPVEVVAVSDAGEDSGDESNSSNSNTSSSSSTSGSDSDKGS
jgi:hypothetical protein